MGLGLWCAGRWVATQATHTQAHIIAVCYKSCSIALSTASETGPAGGDGYWWDHSMGPLPLVEGQMFGG